MSMVTELGPQLTDGLDDIVNKLKAVTPMAIEEILQLTRPTRPRKVACLTKAGLATGYYLQDSPKVAVGRWHLTAGTLLDLPPHPSNEWLICFDGCLKVTIERKMTELHIGQGLVVPGNTPHTKACDVETWYVAVIAPTDAACA